jgi:hypothetical protein
LPELSVPEPPEEQAARVPALRATPSAIAATRAIRPREREVDVIAIEILSDLWRCRHGRLHVMSLAM